MISLLAMLAKPVGATLRRPQRLRPAGDLPRGHPAAAEQHFARVFEQAPAPMAVLSLAVREPGVFVEVNRELVAMTGRSRRELQGLDLVSITDPVDQLAARDALTAWAIGEGVPMAAEWRWQRPDGSSFWVLLAAGPLRGEPGAPIGLIQVVDISERKRAEDRLVRQALHDPLTDLPNRALLDDHLQQALARARRNRTRVAVLYLDLDDFKQINDAFGHAVGDDVLITVADRLRTGLRGADTACRIGGDEFVVICEDLEAIDTGIEMAARLRRMVAKPMLAGGRPLRLGASIGVAVGFGHEDPNALIACADKAMYATKPRCQFRGQPVAGG